MLPNFVQTGYKRINLTLEDVVESGSGVFTTDRERNGRLYASDSGMCERKGVLSSNNGDTSFMSASGTWYVNLGITIEKLVIDALYNQGALLFSNYTLPDIKGLNLGGKVDALIHFNNRIYVLEIKSIGTLPTEPKPLHKTQALIYSAVTGFPAIVYYASRSVVKGNTGKLAHKAIYLQDDYDSLYKVMYRLFYAQKSNEMGFLPDKPFDLSKSVCESCSCPFIPQCWEGQEITQSLKPIDSSSHLKIAKKASEMANDMLSERGKRKNGILKYLEFNGNEYCKSLLAGTDWSLF